MRHPSRVATVFFVLLTVSSFANVAVSSVSGSHSRETLPRLGSSKALSLPSAPNYDEQIGLTFTDSFSALAYNVTAIPQSNGAGYGPAYLLNGLTNIGYWYQVGLSWNWNPGSDPGSGFSMNYEVWDTNGYSIFPTDGGGGLASLSGVVRAGDSVTLSLNFTGASVVMAVRDLDTGAGATVRFLSEAASSFVGLIYPSNSNGYFSGLMTEEYYPTQFFGNVLPVNYSSSSPLTNGFLWADEFTVSPRTTVFHGQKFVSFANPTQIQSFSRNGTTSYADARTFVTGAISQQILTLSYSVSGGGSGYGVPVLKYFRNGSQQIVSLTKTPTSYLGDSGSTWQVSSAMPGGSAEERWETNGQVNGTLVSGFTEALSYFHQYLSTFGYNVTGGGTGFRPPLVRVLEYGNSSSVQGDRTAWVDSGSNYSYNEELPGSVAAERWEASGSLSGRVAGPVNASALYVHQYGLTVSYVIAGGGGPPAPTLVGTALSLAYSSQVVNSTVYYLDSGTAWSASSTLTSGSQEERWLASQGTNGTASSPVNIVLTYQHQYTVLVFASPTNAGTVARPDFWQDAGASISLAQSAASGWRFSYWTGFETARSNTTTIQVNGAVNETAVFYPGLAIVAGAGGAVTYTYGQETGTVPGGTSRVLYVGPNITIILRALPSSFLYAFTGWSGNATGTLGTTTIIVGTPETVRASFGFNVPVVGGGIGAAVLVAVAASALAVRSRRKPTQST